MTLVYVFVAVYALWLLFLAVMNLRRAYEDKRLSRPAIALGLPILVAGFLLDVLVNLTLASIVFLDLPREWTTSERLARYLPQPGWRSVAAAWVATNLLDPFDPSGSHLRK